jgi:hypothetical protein
MGDEAAEDLFVLAALTGIRNITVVLSPVDFRKRDMSSAPAGTEELYAELRKQLQAFPKNE